MKIGITGGIGSGKSYVCQRLKAHGIDVYDCDAAAKRLIRTSTTIRPQLTALIGPEVYIGIIKPDRHCARKLLLRRSSFILSKAVCALASPL